MFTNTTMFISTEQFKYIEQQSLKKSEIVPKTKSVIVYFLLIHIEHN